MFIAGIYEQRTYIMLQQLTSIGDKKVTVRFIGPAVITYMDLVGVIRMLSMLETF